MKLTHDYYFLAFIYLVSVAFNVTYADSIPPKNHIQIAGRIVHSDRVIVRFKSNRQRFAPPSQLVSPFTQLGLEVKNTIKFNQTRGSHRAVNQELIFTVLSLDGSKDLKTVLKQLNSHPSILYAEPDYFRKKSAQPNDPEFSKLWGLNNSGQENGLIDADIDALEAWDTRTDSVNSVIGVIDSGVDYTHEDLAANMWVNPGEISGDGIDNDGNGYVDDIHGIDCANDDTDPMDVDGHGTHIAGTIGAVGDNGIGVTGVNWNTKIMALKFFEFGGGFDSNAIECIAYAVDMKKNHGVDIRITNNSWGNRAFGQALKDAIRASVNANMLFISAAGNSGDNIDFSREYPAGYNFDNIISVAATDRNDLFWIDQFGDGSSNFGASTVDLAAPGQDILSTTLGNQYGLNSGTSMSTPHVTGAAALLWANNPLLTALEIKYRLMDLGDPIADLEGRTASGRRLNINSALNCNPGSPTLKILAPKDQFDLLTGNVVVKARVTDCGESVSKANIQGIPGNGDVSFSLFDNGQGEDKTADDGIYTGIWQLQNPAASSTLTLNSDTLGLSASVTGVALNNTPYKLDDEHSYEWIDATLGTRLGISDYDDTDDVDFFDFPNGSAETITIGFDFEFYGISYSKLDVDSNGILIFGNNHSFFNHPHAPIPLNAHPNGFIAPYWADINPGKSQTSNIYSLLEGTAPNRRLTIAWIETPLADETSRDSSLTFEVTLYEGSNDIIFQYKNAYLADAATIGIEHQSGDYGLQYLYNGVNNGELVKIDAEQAIRLYIEDETITPLNLLIPSDDANNRADLDGFLAISKWEHAFFRFDVSHVQKPVSKAILRVYYEARRAPLNLFVGAVDNDNWSEVGETPALTYIHNKPELQLASVEATMPGYVEFDVTDFVANQINDDDIVTLEVSSSHDNWDILSSKEGFHPPELVIKSGIQFNQHPKAVFDSILDTSGAPLTISLDASESIDQDGEIVSYSWDFGDGSTATGAKISHTYKEVETYIVTLIVTDNEGATATITNAIEVLQSPISITIEPTDDANNRAKLTGVLAISKWEHAFFRFDVSAALQEVSKATLRVHYDALRAPLTLFVGAVNDDNWSEDSGTPALTFIHDSPELQLDNKKLTTSGYVEFDVSGFVADQVNKDGIVTLEVSSNHDIWDSLSSKEGAHSPELVFETTQETTAPSVPAGLTLNSVTSMAISFSWTPSTDDQGTVNLYRIMRDGIEIDTSSVASFTDNTVAADTAYVYNVTAEDNSGKKSAASIDLNVNTATIPSGLELIAAYPFEKGLGIPIVDITGNGNNGILEGDAARNPTGKNGEAIEFNGESSYIDLGAMDIISPTMSIAMWFKADDFGIHDARLISKSTGTAESDHYWMVSTIRSGGQQKLRFRLKTANGGTTTLIGSAVLTPEVWTHVTATYDGVEMKLFQDGVEVGSLTKSGAISTSASVETWIGANPGNTRYFDGLIDDVRIYGKAIGLTTIENIMLGNLPLIP